MAFDKKYKNVLNVFGSFIVIQRPYEDKDEAMFSTRPQLILASQSPRRRYLLEQAGLTFSVIPSTIDESAIQLTEPAEYVKTLAKAKAMDVAGLYPGSWVIGADTIVTIDQAILGKPSSPAAAKDMLVRLSGQSHFVYTGFTITCKEKATCVCDAIQTIVQFKELSDAEIDWYIQTGEPFDKAGAYAIQGLGTFLVRRINGSYTNVVGLPVCEVIETLLKLGIVSLDRKTAMGAKV
jgi:septum formation protein